MSPSQALVIIIVVWSKAKVKYEYTHNVPPPLTPSLANTKLPLCVKSVSKI